MSTSELMIFGAWFDGHTDTTPKPFELSWPEFVEALAAQFHTREDKFDAAPGFNLARFVEKDGVIARQNKHVDVLSGIVLDFDKNYDPATLFDKIDGLVWLAYTTYSHTPAAPRWRLVVPFASAIPAAAYKSVRSWLLARINGNAKTQEADEQAKALSNFFFGPGCPSQFADDAEWLVSDGVVLEVPALSAFKKGTPETRVLGDKIDWGFLDAKMRTHKDPVIRDAFKRVLKGKHFAEHGSRDNTLLRMCGALAGWALQCDPHELAKVFGPSLAVMAEAEPNDPPPDIDGAADKIARAQSSLIAKAREENEMRVEDAQTVDVQLPIDEEQALADAQAAGFDDLDNLRRRLLVRSANSLWMWRTDLGTWVGPLTEAETQAAARLDLPNVPGVQMWQRKVDGGLRLKVLPELFQDYGERADKVTYDLAIDRSVYDSKTRWLRLAAGHRRSLEPTYSEIVNEWLTALGGDKADKLIDWVAGIARLDKANSVLFLKGDPGVGKGLLVRGLSRIWDVDAPTHMKRIAEQFNADLLRCPLVIIDEGKWSRHVDVTSTLREMVTETTRMVNKKHHEMTELVGRLRFIVTANNFNIFANDKHSLNPKDRDAIAERFLEISPSMEARDVIESIPLEERETLATENIIAAHALWLSENREVVPGKRFWVEGDKGGRFAVRIITEDHGFGSWVVEWLARYLSDPIDVDKAQGHLVWRGEGRVIVSPEAIVNTFDRVLKNKKPPQSLEISNALCSLSTGELVKFPSGKGRGFEVLVEEIALWAEEKGVGDPADIRAAAWPLKVAGKSESAQRPTLSRPGNNQGRAG